MHFSAPLLHSSSTGPGLQFLEGTAPLGTEAPEVLFIGEFHPLPVPVPAPHERAATLLQNIPVLLPWSSQVLTQMPFQAQHTPCSLAAPGCEAGVIMPSRASWRGGAVSPPLTWAPELLRSQEY